MSVFSLRRWFGGVVILSAVIAVAPAVHSFAADPPRPKSIFDFDDAPPKPATQPATTPPPAIEPTEPKPETPTPPVEPALTERKPSTGTLTFNPPTATPPTTTPPIAPKPTPDSPTPPDAETRTLLPIPDAKAQEKALRQIKEIFKEEYRVAGADRVATALKLMRAVATVQSDPDGRFVLLREARDMAAAAGDARVGLAAARQIASGYAIDLNEMGLAVLMAACRAANTPERAAQVADIATNLIPRAVESQQFDLAIRLEGIAEGAARVMRSPLLSTKLQATGKDLRARKANADRLPAARVAFEKNPADPDACAVIGRHLWFEDSNFAEAGPLLAKGNDVPLKNLATHDAAAPIDPVAQSDLANQWWTAAQSQSLTARLRMQERAAYWYDRALPSLTGPKHDQAALRIATARAGGAAEVLMLEMPVAADPGKARQLRDALPKGTDFAKDVIDKSVIIPAGVPHLLTGTLTTPEKGDRVDITLEPGAEFRDGKIMLSGRGRLKLHGTPEKPVVLRNVELGMDLGGSVEAEYAVFENCTFRKSGGWFAYFSTKWTFKNCVLDRCRFPRLDGTDYGFKIDSCRLIGMKLPEITHKRDAAKEYNHLARLRRDWNVIHASEFVGCTVSPTVAWCAEDSNFISCTFAPGEAFESPQDFEWHAFVADTVGDGP